MIDFADASKHGFLFPALQPQHGFLLPRMPWALRGFLVP